MTLAEPALLQGDTAALRAAFHAMGGPNEIVVEDASHERARRAIDAAIAEVRRIEAKYSRYRDDSLVARINAAAGERAVEIDAETARLLDYADACDRESEGRFDLTSGVLRRAWRFEQAAPPSQREIDALLPLIGWHKVVRHDASVFLPERGMQIDLGGIGKEYAADRAAQVCREHGIAHGVVNLGGDVALIGAHADGSAWRVGIRHPRVADATLAQIPLESGALATSGDYERFIERDGRRYGHILDARTGWPVASFQSVSVIAPSCLIAGSVATLAMLLPSEVGIAWLADSQLRYLAVDLDGKTHVR